MREQARRLPPALLDQHDAGLAARSALPHARPQRRDQHRHRQPPLDAGEGSGAGARAARRDLARRLRLGLAGQRARAPGPARLGGERGAHEPGARRLGGARRHRGAGAGLLPLSVDPVRALGRPRRPGLQRRRRGRGGPRPQRPPTAALAADSPGDGGRCLGGRRGVDGAGGRGRARKARSRPDAARRHARWLAAARLRGQRARGGPP